MFSAQIVDKVYSLIYSLKEVYQQHTWINFSFVKTDKILLRTYNKCFILVKNTKQK